MRIQYYHKKDNSSVVTGLPTPLELFKQTHTKQEYQQLVSFYKSEDWHEVEKAHLNSDRRYYERRGQSGAENIGNSMHDDCVKENAKLHDKAGLDCYLVRDAGGGCCAWCAAIAGRYKYAEAPDDIFRRHDHCTCTTTYECGRMRQNVWSKRTWQASEKELEQRKALSEVSKPTVNTPKQAKELEQKVLAEKQIMKNTPEQAAELEKQALDKSIQSGILESNGNRINIGMQFFSKSIEDFATIILPKDEYAHVMSEIATNITEEQSTKRVIKKHIGDYIYTVENKGFGNYRVIGKDLIE